MSTTIRGLFFPTDCTEHKVVPVYNHNKKIRPYNINSTQWVPFPPAHEAKIFRLTDVGRKKWVASGGKKYGFYIYHSYEVCMS